MAARRLGWFVIGGSAAWNERTKAVGSKESVALRFVCVRVLWRQRKLYSSSCGLVEVVREDRHRWKADEMG
jgi:hypothetical protein